MLGTGGGGVAFGFDIFMTEFLSISSSSEVIDDELASEGGVAGRGLEEAIGVEIIAVSVGFSVLEVGASLSADI
jgi:hypothetical protein